METSQKKKGTKLWLTLHIRSHQFHVKNQKECVYHDDNCEYEHGKMPTSSKPILWTTCGIQTTSNMAKFSVASVPTKGKSTTSRCCQTDPKSRKLAGTQYCK